MSSFEPDADQLRVEVIKLVIVVLERGTKHHIIETKLSEQIVISRVEFLGQIMI